jgi:hypothetical protein
MSYVKGELIPTACWLCKHVVMAEFDATECPECGESWDEDELEFQRSEQDGEEDWEAFQEEQWQDGADLDWEITHERR